MVLLRPKLSSLAEQVRKGSRSPAEREAGCPTLQASDLLSTGSTLLNLALTGRPEGGYVKGKYFFLVGDSRSGKTFLSMTCMAEAAKNPEFKDYELVYDNVEDGMLMEVAKFFGRSTAKRLRPPRKDKHGDPVFSSTIEDFYYHVDDLVHKGKPFIYVLDSMDALTSADEEKKFEEQKEAARRGKKVVGSYGDGKAKKNSAGLRKLLRGLRKTGSILIIVSQTRDALNAMFGETKTRSGGRALRFYATAEFWSSVVGSVKKTVRGKSRKVGSYVKVQFKKNRLTGREDTVTLAFYPSVGLDDVGSCVDFLVEEGFWKAMNGVIKAEGIGIEGHRDKVIERCEERWTDFLELVEGEWQALAEEQAIRRKTRYE